MGQPYRTGSIFFDSKKVSKSIVQFFIALSIFGLYLSGCVDLGGGGSGKSDSGDVVVGLTDAASDFLKYEVQVVSLTLKRNNGAIVQALPVRTTVDFAQYVEMTEFLTAATIPAGQYISATMHIDYQKADILVADSSGNPVAVADQNILNENDVPISTISISVHLKGRNSLFIAPGLPAHLTLDFDLGASNQVDLSHPEDPILRVRPTVIANVNPSKPKIHRLRGPLKAVNLASETFSLAIRPFIHAIAGADEPFGDLNVFSNSSTCYDINGHKFKGRDGLAALEQQPDQTAVIVIGDLNMTTRQFEATQVYAGSSVPGGALDVVAGNVVSRRSNELIVKGARLTRSGGSIGFNEQITIQLSVNTTVNRQHSIARFSIDDISVGQQIMAFGKLNDGETQLDAINGHIGMLLTTVSGTVVNAADSRVTVKLSAIDSRKIDQFDFTGTGAASDAKPDEYKVKTGSLNIAGLQAGDPVKLRGFVADFGHFTTSGDFDFTAQTVLNVSNAKGLLIVTWEPPALGAITDLSADNFSLDLKGAGSFHHLNRAGVVTDLTLLEDAPIIESANLGEGLFQIVQNGDHQFYYTFDEFREELTLRMDSSSVAYVTSTGVFDDANTILTAKFLIVGLE